MLCIHFSGAGVACHVVLRHVDRVVTLCYVIVCQHVLLRGGSEEGRRRGGLKGSATAWGVCGDVGGRWGQLPWFERFVITTFQNLYT